MKRNVVLLTWCMLMLNSDVSSRVRDWLLVVMWTRLSVLFGRMCGGVRLRWFGVVMVNSVVLIVLFVVDDLV